jgi:hypothetical protein
VHDAAIARFTTSTARAPPRAASSRACSRFGHGQPRRVTFWQPTPDVIEPPSTTTRVGCVAFARESERRRRWSAASSSTLGKSACAPAPAWSDLRHRAKTLRCASGASFGS